MILQYIRQHVSPVTLAIILGLVIPSVCISWLLFKSLDNERIATRQKLESIYRQQIVSGLESWQQFWSSQKKQAQTYITQQSTAQAFQKNAQLHPSVLTVLKIQDEQPDYITHTKRDYSTSYHLNQWQKASDWKTAQRYEFVEKNYDEACQRYQEIANLGTMDDQRELAVIAYARCLVKRSGDGDIPNAIKQLFSLTPKSTGTNSHSFVVDAYMRGLELAAQLARENPGVDNKSGDNKSTDTPQDASQRPPKNSHRIKLDALFKKMEGILNDYTHINIPSRQRYLTMKKTMELANATSVASTSTTSVAKKAVALPKTTVTFPTFQAEAIVHSPINWETLHDGVNLLEYTDKSLSNDKTASTLAVIYDTTTQIAIITHSLDLHKTLEYYLYRNVSNADFNILTKFSKQSLSKDDILFYSRELPVPFNSEKVFIYWKEGNELQREITKRSRLYIWTGSAILGLLLASSLFFIFNIRRQEKLSRLKNDVAATVSHELKTPLTSIRLLIDNLLEDKNKLTPETMEYIEIIRNENYRLSSLVDNFLTYSRIERGKHVLHIDAIEINQLIDECIQVLNDKFSKNDVNLTIDIQCNHPINCDEALMKTAIINLLDNACKYTTNPKNIRLAAKECEQQVHISVTDNGIGLSPKDCKKIFNRFYRVDQHLHRQTEGCGLGLHITAYIMRIHHGSVSVTSTPNEGSTFTLKLPL